MLINFVDATSDANHYTKRPRTLMAMCHGTVLNAMLDLWICVTPLFVTGDVGEGLDSMSAFWL